MNFGPFGRANALSGPRGSGTIEDVRTPRSRLTLVACAVAGLCAAACTAERRPPPADFGAFGGSDAPPPTYHGSVTRSVYIPMRDGVRIAAEVVLPAGLAPEDRIPALMVQTRYWRQRVLRAPFSWFLEPSDLDAYFSEWRPFLVGQGYAVVVVDVRGTGASFGAWPYPWAEDSVRDAGEVAAWVTGQPWSNGRVGGYGISYLGTTAELLAASGNPSVGAVVPMFNHPDSFTDIAFPGGIFNQRFIRSWGDFDRTLDDNVVPPEFGRLGQLAIAGVKPVDADADHSLLAAAVRDHRDNAHAFSLARPLDFRDQPPEGLEVTPDDIAVHRFADAIATSGAASFGFGSWMDAGTADATLRRWLTFDNARWAAIGAWEHGGRFDASPYRRADGPARPPLQRQWIEMVRFFDAHLRGDGSGVEKTLFYYTLAEEVWKATPVWPPAGTTNERWYLGPSGALVREAPAEPEGADRFMVDFAASTGEHNRWWEMGGLWGDSITYRGRREAAAHMQVYTTPPLAEDVEITGYPVVTLYVASTHADCAFYVYLEDVDPRGEVTYVTEGQLRAIHRKVSTGSPYVSPVPYHSFRQADAAPLVPGEVAEVTFGLHPTSVLIRKGHRIRIGIAGHDAGTFQRYPAEGAPVWRIHRDPQLASRIDLPRAPRAPPAR